MRSLQYHIATCIIFLCYRRVGLQLPNTAASAAWAAQPQIPAAVTAQGAPIQQPAAAAAPTIIPAYPATMQQFQVSTQNFTKYLFI